MDYIIEMLNITKIFPGIIANDNITLQLKKGEIHALLGENGAGKSTLMSVLFGLYQPEGGSIKKNGKPVKINGPNDATRIGIGMVHQHFKLVHNFTILENIILGVEDKKKGILKIKDATKKIEQISSLYSLEIDLNKEIRDISVGMQQRVEILKMLYRNNEILIFDEPTAVLTPQEIEALMETMNNLVSKGKSIIFITHKLDEIKAVADRCTVLRKGKYIGTVNVSETTKEDLSEMMVGRKVSLSIQKKESKLKETVLEVKNLTLKGHDTKNLLTNINFNVKAGEILCLAGIEGNGQTQIVNSITGLGPVTAGEILFLGNDITHMKIRKRTELGISHIPEDRHKHGLVLDYDLSLNVILQSYYTPRFKRWAFLSFKEIQSYAKYLIKKFDIRASHGEKTITRSLSGGNQQKVIIARELDRNPKLIIAVQPTRGLDVGAIEYIHKQLLEQRDSGSAVLLVSLELEEVMNISDRVIVMYEGEIVADINPKDVSFKELGLYMSGSTRNVSLKARVVEP